MTAGQNADTNREATMDDQFKMLLDDRDKQISVLRIELRQAKEMERKLWVAVARLQQAVGEANAWGTTATLPDPDRGGYALFDKNKDAATDILGDIIGLTPAE